MLVAHNLATEVGHYCMIFLCFQIEASNLAFIEDKQITALLPNTFT
jgi:hypothetical protein